MKKRHWLRQLITFLTVLMLALTSFLPAVSAATNDDNINARAAIVMDAQTGQVLYAKNAQKKYPVASCVKILTLAVIEQDIAKGKLSWNQKIKISKDVAKTSTDWHFSNVELKAGRSYTIWDLANSMMIVSADGSAEALALADAGSTAAFNRKMQALARKAGVTDAKIYNMIGLSNGELGKQKLKGVPDSAENQFSASDMAKIARYTVNKYPKTLEITKQRDATFKVDDQQSYHMQNLNAMLPNNGLAPKNGSIDGLKTGTTDKAGNCFVGTGVFNNRRIVTVVMKVPGSFSAQFQETQKMIDQVLASQDPVPVKSLKALGLKNRQEVAHSRTKHVKLALAANTAIWFPKGQGIKQVSHPKLQLAKSKTTITGQRLKAPIKKGQQVGSVKVKINQNQTVKLPVVAASNAK